MQATRTRSNGFVVKSCTGFCPAGRKRVLPMSDFKTMPLAGIVTSAFSGSLAQPPETPAIEAPTPARAEALRKSRREELELVMDFV
jgi:hypothetical protein